MSPDPTHREVLFQLTDVSRALRTYVDQCARRHGMTRAQWAVLLRLDRREGMTQAEMADALEIQPISLVRLIDRLCEQKLVERRPHPSDRRANRLYLTPKGRATLEDLAPLGRDISGEVLAGFGDSEIRRMLQQLMRIKDNIRAAAEADTAARRAANGER
jgi:MarR family transcriptional regulator, transcriptional regulator for hemolysin